ncbi:hypothetical protein BKA61DRAFT_617382 [Leptodontidium sp. MPI-SDFR-AT-0119]|nr:hypothetical protein BKA61DRAFT_617382 [Leptodontidium sp. MPI-SDFR-AT-0119]
MQLPQQVPMIMLPSLFAQRCHAGITGSNRQYAAQSVMEMAAVIVPYILGFVPHIEHRIVGTGSIVPKEAIADFHTIEER